MIEPVRYSIEDEAADPSIRSLDVSCFDRSDLLNMLLQRSEVLFDVSRPGAVIRSWVQGQVAPIESEIDRLGEEIPRRVAGVLQAEYRAMRPVLKRLKPKRIADIGCGYAIFDLFVSRDTGCDLLLIDIESNENRHFGYAEEAAAYTSLEKARRFLSDNGVAGKKIQCVNPQTEDLSSAGQVDLVVSFVSCGFHYPADTYLRFFENSVSPDGGILLDLRNRTAKEQFRTIAHLGVPVVMPGHPKAARTLILRGD